MLQLDLLDINALAPAAIIEVSAFEILTHIFVLQPL